MMIFNDLVLRKQEGVATIVLIRPDRRNALGEQISTAIKTEEHQEAVKAFLLKKQSTKPKN